MKIILLLFLVSLCVKRISSLDPATNIAVRSCNALSQSLGPQSLSQCQSMLPPSLFGYNTSVEVNIEVKTIYGLGDAELLEWSGWILMSWTDPRLAWNATETGTRQMRLDRNSLWIPDIGYWNAKSAEFFDFRNAKFLEAIASPDGSVYTYIYTLVQFPCSLDMRLFPFDRQTCALEIGAINSDSSVFTFKLSSQVSPGSSSTSAFFGVGEWDLTKLTQTVKFEIGAAGFAFQFVNLRFHLQRRVTYYAILMIVPYELLSLLASIMFFAEQQGDRANVSIAIIMSMTLYVLIASQSAPKSMNVIPLVGAFLITQMLILICFTFVAVFRLPKDADPALRAPGQGKRHSKAVRCLTGFLSLLIRHKDRICFISYMGTSAFNALCFLCIWPAAA